MLILPTREFPKLSREILFFKTCRELSLCLGPAGESSMILGKFCLFCNLLGIWLMVLTNKGVSLVIFNPLRDALRVLVSSILLRVFLSFLGAFLSISFHFPYFGIPLGIF